MIQEFKNKFPSFFKATLFGSALTVAAGCSAKTDIPGETVTKASTKPDHTTNTAEKKEEEPKKKPNIIYIVLDDSGFSDLGSYGSEIKTPNIDKLAQNGLRYNNFHVTPVCSPTRASLLTGRNPHAVGIGTVTNFDFGPNYPNRRGAIVPEAATAAEVLSEQGYNTYALGKWHLAPTSEVTPAGPYHNWPLAKGFQRYYGFLEDSADQYKPELTEDNHPIPMPEKEDYHVSEDLIDKSRQYLVDKISVTPDKPFFMYLAFGAQHQPHQVPQKYIDMYDGVYDEGWEKIREQRFEKQKKLGIIPKDTKLAPLNPGIKKWGELTDKEKEVYTRFQETYAGFLTHTDEQVGKLIDFLEEKGELDNTIITFIADNGASAIGGLNGSLNHTLAYNMIPENVDDIAERMDEMGSETVSNDYPAGWAQVSNTPFKLYKKSTYAGGTHTPLIVHWPDGIKAKGEIRSQYVHVSDITATMYDILGIDLPKTIKGIEQMPIHGKSFADSFNHASAESVRKTQYFEIAGQRAIYHNGWRAISNHTQGEPFEDDKWELYHVEEDFSEMNDLAKEEPEKLKELKELWDKEAEKYNVFPMTDLFLEAFPNTPEDSPRARDTFTYYPEMTHLSDSASPPIINRSYTIDVPITYKNGDEGVLVALGNHESGYTLYIKDNRLVYEYHNGVKRYVIKSKKDLKQGKLNIQFEFTKTGDFSGIGSLYVNKQKVGEEEIDSTLPLKVAFEGLDIGEDLMNPVSPEYKDQKEFAYTGEIEKVVFHFKDKPYVTVK